jgi:hypothetical protein
VWQRALLGQKTGNIGPHGEADGAAVRVREVLRQVEQARCGGCRGHLRCREHITLSMLGSGISLRFLRVEPLACDLTVAVNMDCEPINALQTVGTVLPRPRA